MTTTPIILVPGFWLGAWAWDEVASLLRADGHDVTAITLPGLESADADRSSITFEDHVNAIIDAIKTTLDRTPPELAADIMDRGIVLAGGGALLHGLDERLRHETQMPVHLAESPLTCVAVGSGRSLEEFEAIHRSARARPRRNGRRY